VVSSSRASLRRFAPAEPFPVQQVSAGQVSAHPGPAEMRDGSAERWFGGAVVAQEGS
jgi:hypothetical protein